MSTFREQLKSLRTEKGLSQRQLADELGITRSAYANYEQGIREPDFATLAKLCRFFEISADEILCLKK